jgi:hypothetical protein
MDGRAVAQDDVGFAVSEMGGFSTRLVLQAFRTVLRLVHPTRCSWAPLTSPVGALLADVAVTGKLALIS